MLQAKVLRWAFLRESRKQDPEGKRVIQYCTRMVDVWQPKFDLMRMSASTYWSQSDHSGEPKKIWNGMARVPMVAKTYRKMLDKVSRHTHTHTVSHTVSQCHTHTHDTLCQLVLQLYKEAVKKLPKDSAPEQRETDTHNLRMCVPLGDSDQVMSILCVGHHNNKKHCI